MVKSKRIAAIDWMRGFVMILMALDHVSMAYDAQHISSDSAALYVSGTPLPDFAFLTRWISHLCAPVFVFLAGTALAISVERKVAKGFDSGKVIKIFFCYKCNLSSNACHACFTLSILFMVSWL